MGAWVGVLLLGQLLVRAELETQDMPDEDQLFSGFQNSSLLTSPCGHPNIRPLVIGGKDSLRGRWPWQASLRLSTGHACGGSLLNHRWVLSAAHCFEKNKDPSEWTVQLGELSAKPPFWNLRAFYHRYKVQDIFVYPYFRGVLLNDIALLRLSSSVTYNKYIKPICVLDSSVDFQNRTDCWVTGWGQIHEDEELPAPYILQEVQVSIINNSRCNQLFRPPIKILDDMICAGFENGSRDTCRGDSGGPLTCEENGLWHQIGIVSWGIGCGRPNRPGVYTNVSRYFNWIRMVMAHSTPRPDLRPLLLLLALLWAALLLQLA